MKQLYSGTYTMRDGSEWSEGIEGIAVARANLASGRHRILLKVEATEARLGEEPEVRYFAHVAGQPASNPPRVVEFTKDQYDVARSMIFERREAA